MLGLRGSGLCQQGKSTGTYGEGREQYKFFIHGFFTEVSRCLCRWFKPRTSSCAGWDSQEQLSRTKAWCERQNSNRTPNWKDRGFSRTVPLTLSPVTVPKSPSPTDVSGGAKRAWLNALNVSARTSIRMPSLGTNDL